MTGVRYRDEHPRQPDHDPAYDAVYESMCRVMHPAVAAIEAHLRLERQAA